MDHRGFCFHSGKAEIRKIESVDMVRTNLVLLFIGNMTLETFTIINTEITS